MKKITWILLLAPLFVCGQTKKFNLEKLLEGNKYSHLPDEQCIAMADSGKFSKVGVSANGVIWLNDVNFDRGTIEIDLRGRDSNQFSFIGIAFHGIDTVNHEAVFFRPFNFQSNDTLRKKHSVQYICPPDYTWERLRKEQPLTYENECLPSPKATDWFHAKIVVTGDSVSVFVNHSKTVSIKVKRLTNRNGGKLGLWDYGLLGDFANLRITPDI